MARRSALPDDVRDIPAEVGKRCGTCDTASWLCPRCPKRQAGSRDREDHGWAQMRRQYGHALAEAMYLDARLARSMAITHEAHPAYPELLAEYRRSGDRVRALREAQR